MLIGGCIVRETVRRIGRQVRRHTAVGTRGLKSGRFRTRRSNYVCRSKMTLTRLKSAGMSIALIACSKGPCLTEPCPLPMAITINVTSGASGASLTNAFANDAPTQ
jgi:hypothetical protein